MENKSIFTLITSPYGEVIQMTTEDGTISSVPTDPANSDYQAYLASQKEEK